MFGYTLNITRDFEEKFNGQIADAIMLGGYYWRPNQDKCSFKIEHQCVGSVYRKYVSRNLIRDFTVDERTQRITNVDYCKSKLLRRLNRDTSDSEDDTCLADRLCDAGASLGIYIFYFQMFLVKS